VTTPWIFGVLAIALLAIVLGARFIARTARLRGVGGVLLVAGFGAVGIVALWHLTARFGPELVWFRAPTFYAAMVILVVGLLWWLQLPFSRARRIGTVAGFGALAGAFLLLTLGNGRGMPPSMLMPTMNRAAPDFIYLDSTGRERRFSELQGNLVLINFWATWCAPCRHEMPLLAKLQREYEPQRFRVLYLSLEDPQVLDAFLARNHFDGIQGRLAAAPPFYDAGKFYPLSYLVGRNGQVIARWSGRPGEAWLDQRIRANL
jgi:thiol-disulfide isomerase/thioredoxin